MTALLRHKEERDKSRWRLPLFFALAIFASILFIHETVWQIRLTYQGVETVATVVDVESSGRTNTFIGEFSDRNGVHHKTIINFPGRNLGLHDKISIVYYPSNPGHVYPKGARRFTLVVAGFVLASLLWGCLFSESMNRRKVE